MALFRSASPAALLNAARPELKEILRRYPSDYRSRNNLAGIYRMTGRSKLAVDEIQEITTTRPDYVPAWQNLGQLQAEMGNWSEAETAFLRVTQIDPRNPGGHLGLAYVLRPQGRLEEASREEQQARVLGGQPVGR